MGFRLCHVILRPDLNKKHKGINELQYFCICDITIFGDV